jgi:hypothetical protein
MCYIEGGIPEGTNSNYEGCSDKNPPREDKKIIIPHELYFSKSSSIWENKAVAFIKSTRDGSARTLGRMYLITCGQFTQVVRQENGLKADDASLSVDFEKVKEKRGLVIDANKWYGRILYLGDEDGYPILTFTAPWGDDEIVTAEPGEKYLRTIRSGIRETYKMTENDINQYFLNKMS